MVNLSRWQRIKNGYIRFVEKQGFAVVMVVCVAVITGTAVWTRKADAPYVAPTPPVSRDVSAAQLYQESLADVRTAVPSPTLAPVVWQRPLDHVDVLQGFDADGMVQSAVTGIWMVHDAIDLAADTGTAIRALAAGTVVDCGIGGTQGAWARVAHPDGIEALYAGMSMLAALQTGDTVVSGQTIGFAGNEMLAESNLPPHLHLRVTRNGVAVDPMTLLEKAAR